MAESAPVFVQVLSSILFIIPSGQGDAASFCGYLLGSGDSPPDQPITIDQALNNFSGHFLFALKSPKISTDDDVKLFIQNVQNYIQNNYGGTARVCMWMPNPDSLDPANFQRYDFSFGISGIGTTNFVQSNLNSTLSSQVTFSVQQGAVLKTNSNGLTIASPGSNQYISLLTGSGTQFSPTIAPNQVTIPFNGAYKGCCLFSGQITPNLTLNFFNTGFQYAHANNGNGSSADSIQNYPLLLTDQTQPAFNFNAALDMLDPLNQNSTTVDLAAGQLRTLFAPTGNPQFPSWLRTATNRSISLVPIGSGDVSSGPAPNSGAFAFEQIQQPTGGNLPKLYLTPTGNFALAVDGVPLSGAGAGAVNNLLCGIFGTESVSFRSYSTDVKFDYLNFTPHQNAYAPNFPFAAASLDNFSNNADQPRLNNTYQTAWANMINSDQADVFYQAQPEASPLYNAPPSAAADNGITILSAFDPKIKLPSADLNFPFVPYTGFSQNPPTGFDPSDLQIFESQIIAATRKQEISEKTTHLISAMKQTRMAKMAEAGFSAEDDDSILTTTPQGLLAKVTTGNAGTDYIKVTLGISADSGNFSPNTAFNYVQAELQHLLQTNQLFSVAVNPKFFGTLLNGKTPTGTDPSFENTATIAGWTFTADIGSGATSTDYRNVMIFKFSDGTVEDWVTNPNKWVDTTNFSIPKNAGDSNIALIGLSTWLQNFIASAKEQAKTNTLYQNFVDNIVTNKNWNGILVLRADVDTSGFPDQIKGLAAGIDASTFEAHHFGITVSRVTVTGTDIQMQVPSSMFGLIDYQNPLFRQNQATGANPDTPLPVPVSGDYGFTVLQLQALFKNSALVDFRSRIQLDVKRLFGSTIRQTFGQNGQTPVSAVVLKGSYQTQGKTSTYVFQQDNPTFFTLNSNILQAVTFEHVQFNTLTSNSGGDQASIQSRFLIWGMFDFALLTANDKSDFDILSFGSPAGTIPAKLGTGLSFSNLQINLQSPVATPNSITYTFEPHGLAFDLAGSTLRLKDDLPDENLFSDLALQLDGFIASTDEKRPSDFGFLPVQQQIPLTGISGEWYGVVYKVTMGTPGALVSGAGFESRILLAWSPQTDISSANYSVFTGLQLPGAAPGAKLLSIQGILKLSIDSIMLTHDPVQGTPTEKAFNLRLNNVGLKFLGIVKLPPGATINFFLFGAPKGKGSLGWYAAYIQDSGSQENSAEIAEITEPDSGLILLPENVEQDKE